MILLFCLGLIFVHTATSASISATTASGCTLTALNKHNEKFWPMFTQNYEFIYAPKTSANGEISIPAGKIVEILCPGNTIVGLETKTETQIATCEDGKFKVGTKSYDLASTRCTAKPSNTAVLSEGVCPENSKEITIGFNISKAQKIHQIRLCFDTTTQLALYSHYTISKAIEDREVGVVRPDFKENKQFYKFQGKSINELYSINSQKKTFNKLLGYDSSDSPYIKSDGKHYLSRGHYAAKNEFVYGSQQNATFHSINVGPQWQIFNGGNWETLESNLTAYADKLSKDFEIYTGTFGISTLPNEKGTQRIPLYLYVNGNDKSLPVPELFWKAIYEPISKKAVVVFGVNNPYYKNIKEIVNANSIICPDILSSLKNWLTFKNSHDIQQGYMYACKFAEAKKKITYLPDWKVTGPLV